MKYSITKTAKLLVLVALVVTSAAGLFFQNRIQASGFSGKIFTTTFNGQPVNVNNYSSKDAVYLSGGPVHEGAEGLPDGSYYFQVTGPSGNDLLSTDLAVCRQLIVAYGRVAAADGPACQHSTGIPASDGSLPVKLMPFNDTPNPGGNHKAWLIRKTSNTSVAADGIHINFKNSDAKTEVFKVNSVPCTNCSPVTLSGQKFYDANQNALFDLGEVPVEGVKISIDYTINGDDATNIVTTDASGNWSVVVPMGAAYRIGEYLPYTGGSDQTGSFWAQTAPLSDSEGFQGYSGTAAANLSALNFGNICFDSSGASPDPCFVSYAPPPTPTPGPDPTPTPTPCADCPTSELSGTKFYDANANGAFDGGEVTLQGVQIAAVITFEGNTTISVATTNADGNWSLNVPIGAQYIIGEYLPDTGSVDPPGSFWQQTAPSANAEGFRGYFGTMIENQSGFNFGDVCFHPGGNPENDPPVASATPCGISYPGSEPTPTPTPAQ